MRFTLNSTLSTILLVVFLQFAGFSQTIQSEIKNLSEGADVIVIGKVVDQKSHWNEGKTRILTQATIQVDEFLKGNNNETSIYVITPGGEVGEVGELYSHMPRFSNDEEVLLFAKKDKRDASYKVLNGEDGKLTLHKDKSTGERVTSFNKKVSTLKKEIKSYVEKQ